MASVGGKLRGKAPGVGDGGGSEKVHECQRKNKKHTPLHTHHILFSFLLYPVAPPCARAPRVSSPQRTHLQTDTVPESAFSQRHGGAEIPQRTQRRTIQTPRHIEPSTVVAHIEPTATW